MSNFFDSFKSEKREASLISAPGKYIVKLIGIILLNSFLKKDGEEISEKPAWSDPTPQVLATFITDDGKLMYTRLNGLGYKRFSKLSEKELKSNKFISAGAQGYAIDKKTHERIPDEENTQACHNILNEFFSACNLPEGSTIDDLKNLAAASEKRKLEIEVVEKTYMDESEEKSNLRIKRYKAVRAAVPISTDFE